MYKIVAPRTAVGALRSSIVTRRAFDSFGFSFGDFFGSRLRNVSLTTGFYPKKQHAIQKIKKNYNNYKNYT